MAKYFFVLLLIPLFFFSTSEAREFSDRFYRQGDGALKITNAKTGASGTYVYSHGMEMDAEALKKIEGVFGLGAASRQAGEFIHPRLIALLDYLQDELKGGAIRIISGYRSPTYNEGLRKKGRLAAKTSMHIEGMAADIEMDGVDGRKLWEFVRGLDCCGAGYYHGKGIHVDVGPSRFWDEKTTGVEKNLGGGNKLVIINTRYDVYRPGETVALKLGRISDYPIGVAAEASLVTKDGKTLRKISINDSKTACLSIGDHRMAGDFEWKIPEDFDSKEPLQIKVDFCQKLFPDMPDSIVSNAFSIRK
jgi:uncharacterized protein YcbK (DUF882 family)